MFEVDPAIGLAGAATRARLDAASNARIADRYEVAYEDWKALAKRLQRENAELRETTAQWKLAHDLKAAACEGHQAVVEAFKAQHAGSPLLVEEGKLKNGNPRRRSTSLWIAAFDAAARKLGVADPAAHRIS